MQYLVKVLWKCVQLIPQSVRAPIRNNIYLSSWYTALLCRVGMHPSVNMKLAQARQATTSDLPEDTDYLNNINHQSKQIEDLLDTLTLLEPINTVVLVVDHWDRDKCAKTLDSIYSQSVIAESIVFLCQSSDYKTIMKYVATVDYLLQSCVVTMDLDSLNSQDLNQSCFVIAQGDVLHEDCLACISVSSKEHDICYVDTDIKINDRRFAPRFLPDWNPDLQLSTSYINTGVYFKRLDLVKKIKAGEYECAQLISDHYLSSLAVDSPTYSIAHLPLVLVHQHAHQQQINSSASVRDTSEIFKSEATPLVSIVIPTYNGKDLVEACINSILDKTSYTHYELLLIDNNSDDEDALAYFDLLSSHESIRVIKYPHPFNYSAINNFAVTQAKGDIIALVNNDIEVIEGDWLSKMVTHVLRDDIACVGAKLLYSNGLIQHAGVVLGYGGGAGHAHKYFKSDDPGYLNRAIATQNFSAVTAACLLVSKEDFESINGLNETDLTIAFNDVDFCLRLAETGKRNLLCAEAVLFHHESVSRGHEDTYDKKKRFMSEVHYLQSTWSKYIEHDPAYNPNLTLKYENFTINTELSN